MCFWYLWRELHGNGALGSVLEGDLFLRPCRHNKEREREMEHIRCEQEKVRARNSESAKFASTYSSWKSMSETKIKQKVLSQASGIAHANEPRLGLVLFSSTILSMTWVPGFSSDLVSTFSS